MAKTPGSLWVSGNELHFVDPWGNQWYCASTYIQAVTARPGSLWIDGYYLRYINQDGSAVFQTPLTFTGQYAGIPGSIWIDTQDGRLHFISGAEAAHFVAHDDVAHNDGGTNIHNDTPHSDTHTDAHTNVAHHDYHLDSPHEDYHADSHTNVAGHNDHQDDHVDRPQQNFYDHMDCSRQYYNPFLNVHLDCYSSPAGYSHTDLYHYDTGGDNTGWTYVGYTNHNDEAHADEHLDYHTNVAHNDQHTNSPHYDEAPEIYHDDSPHQDVHYDVAHTDSAHVDHNDQGHADTPHHDNPVYVGP